MRQAPFRLARLVLFGGGAFAAFIALFTTLPALVRPRRRRFGRTPSQ